MLLKRPYYASKLYDNTCKICQQLKNRKTPCGYLPPKIRSELKPRYLVHVELIGPYRNYIRKQQIGGAIIRNNDSLTCRKIINPATGWFEIVEITMEDHDDDTTGNDEYIDKPSARVRQLFNCIWLYRYPRPRKVVFDNGSDFKRDFTPLIKVFDINLS